jgi:hypothetical protein
LGGQRVGNHEKRGDSAEDRKPDEHWTSLLGPNLAYHLVRLRIKRAAHGYAETREAAMAAFAKSWRRE